MPWKELTPMSQREAFVAAALEPEANLSQLCLAFGISRKSGYKWLARYQAEGRAGLEERSRRPRTSPVQTSAQVEQWVVEARQTHPAWGARKLKAWLRQQGHDDLPAVSTLTAILRRYGLLDEAQAAKHRPAQRFERAEPNQLWQMDFKGGLPLQDGHVGYPLSLLDDHSRFLLMLPACADMSHLTVQQQLTTVFRTYGLPEQMLMDNGSPWGNSADFPHTRLSVWLLRLGIRVAHGRPYHPQTQGKVERFHRTLKAEVGPQMPFADLAACHRVLTSWREVYNTQRPHQALGQQPPAQHYRPSLRPFPERLPEPSYAASDHVRQVQSTGLIDFRGQSWRVGKAFQGLAVALRPDPLTDGRFQILFLQSLIAHLDLKTHDVTLV